MMDMYLCPDASVCKETCIHASEHAYDADECEMECIHGHNCQFAGIKVRGVVSPYVPAISVNELTPDEVKRYGVGTMKTENTSHFFEPLTREEADKEIADFKRRDPKCTVAERPAGENKFLLTIKWSSISNPDCLADRHVSLIQPTHDVETCAMCQKIMTDHVRSGVPPVPLYVPPKPTCETCAAFHEGQCRKNAPTAAPRYGEAVWPIVEKSDWCKQHE